MGLLDDAIREHLELKRRSGADASELARLERDAFGAPDAGAAEDAAHAAHDSGEAGAVATSKDSFDAEGTPSRDAEHADEPQPEPEQPTRQFTAEEMREAQRRDAPAPEPAPTQGPEPAPGEHDELEETPEFLQETPEHDKLWFEQKPPKDFDF